MAVVAKLLNRLCRLGAVVLYNWVMIELLVVVWLRGTCSKQTSQ